MNTDFTDAASERISCEQAAKLLDCSKSHLYRLIKTGVIPCASRMGKRKGIKVFRSDVEKYLFRVSGE